ncbi:acyl-CoA dehydrogenase [Peribacillus cavernae]|uniref:Acyl-CoA dehydrogenase n=1 Tax=Peribacillus cavernae TaxID=1674310 RepID=A0A3S0W5J8_9BACI|nr:acyl-CoA dehydrogenase family protein [Peribacillus cavernae]MDQ0217703.1 alkylation response protein AidB-like acyl-CoA dehydrogenase [Peribacillus cavernae]RUQ28171.1 acyl-CoA dehydrogenase [Peribacillus cavernae]
MFFGFTDEEKMLRRSVREMFKARNTSEHVRAFMENVTISNDMKKLLAGQGLLGIIDLDGSGEDGKGMMNAILIAQEAGRHLLTYPLLEAMAGLAALKTCTQQTQLVSEVEDGKKVLTIAWVNVDAKARKTKDGYVLNGTLREVPFARGADIILANVRAAGMGFTPEEEETLIVLDAKSPNISIHNANSLDETYPLYEINLFNYPLRKEAVVKGFGMGTGHELMTKMRQIGALLVSAELVGCSERALYVTVEYTKQRKQFGVLIGSFQAVKHMAADMYLQVESGKAAVEYAAWALETNNEEADLAVSIAKSYASDAGIQVCGDAIQMHGGIGFTWENDMHLYFKRARRSAAVLGDVYSHREKIAKVAIDELACKSEVEARRVVHAPV